MYEGTHHTSLILLIFLNLSNANGPRYKAVSEEIDEHANLEDFVAEFAPVIAGAGESCTS